MSNPDKKDIRPLGRMTARELSPEEIAEVSGGKSDHTHATGFNGDDPGDPGDLA